MLAKYICYAGLLNELESLSHKNGGTSFWMII